MHFNEKKILSLLDQENPSARIHIDSSFKSNGLIELFASVYSIYNDVFLYNTFTLFH